MTAVTELLSAPIAAILARLAARRSFGNMIVTNVPGPPMPTYMLGALALEAYPLVPLAPTQALNVAVLSYNGVLPRGFDADWDAVPNLADFVALVNEEIEALRSAAHPAAAELSAVAAQNSGGNARGARRRRRRSHRHGAADSPG